MGGPHMKVEIIACSMVYVEIIHIQTSAPELNVGGCIDYLRLDGLSGDDDAQSSGTGCDGVVGKLAFKVATQGFHGTARHERSSLRTDLEGAALSFQFFAKSIRSRLYASEVGNLGQALDDKENIVNSASNVLIREGRKFEWLPAFRRKRHGV